jgi:hypothetical protein
MPLSFLTRQDGSEGDAAVVPADGAEDGTMESRVMRHCLS